MKKLLAVLATMGGIALADTVSTPVANTFVNIPAGFAGTTATGNTPYWNNITSDVTANTNVGNFVTNSGGFAGNTLSPTGSQYLTTVANNNNAPLSFSMLRAQTSINVTILYQNAALTNPNTSFGIYDVNNIANKITIYGAGTINAGNVGGAGINQSTTGISGIGNYGFFATECQPGFPSNCFTFYSDTSLNPSVTNSGNPTVLENGTTNPHQHFALFTLNGNATTFYLGFESSVSGTQFDGVGGPEKYGDFNDVIFQITTAGVPEPATISMMGLGLLGLGLMGRRRLRK